MNTPNLAELPALSLDQIKEGLGIMKKKGNDFAASLLSGIARFGSLTPGQRPWGIKLAAEGLGIYKGAPRKGDNLGAEFSKLIEKFKTAKENGLKRPALTFAPANLPKIKIYPAKETGNNPGFLYVKGDAYFGKINDAGEFFASRDCRSEVLEFLKNLGNDPVQFSARYGRETGNCCFCGLRLTDGRSVRAGFGPVCADHWGLPWGEE